MAKPNNVLKLNASQSDIWSNCPGSLKHLKPDSKGKQIFDDLELADKGILNHHLAELYIKEAIKKGFPDPEKGAFFDFDKAEKKLDVNQLAVFKKNEAEILDYLDFYYLCVWEDLKDAVSFDTELKLVLNVNNRIKMIAIIDLLIETPDKIITIDYKTGLKKVDADRNPQLSLAVTLLKENKKYVKLFETKKTELRIIQPSIGFVSYGDPVEFSKENIKNSIKNLKNKPEYVTGPHCLYCPASDICKEYKKVIKRYLQPDIEDELTERPDLWAEILEMSGPVKKNIERVEKLINEAAIKGGIKIPGYTNGVSYGRRAFIEKDPVKLSKKVGLKKGEVIDEKIKTPAQIEKLLKAKNKKQKLEGLTVTPSRVVLIPEVDLFSDESGDGGGK